MIQHPARDNLESIFNPSIRRDTSIDRACTHFAERRSCSREQPGYIARDTSMIHVTHSFVTCLVQAFASFRAHCALVNLSSLRVQLRHTRRGRTSSLFFFLFHFLFLLAYISNIIDSCITSLSLSLLFLCVSFVCRNVSS